MNRMKGRASRATVAMDNEEAKMQRLERFINKDGAKLKAEAHAAAEKQHREAEERNRAEAEAARLAKEKEEEQAREAEEEDVLADTQPPSGRGSRTSTRRSSRADPSGTRSPGELANGQGTDDIESKGRRKKRFSIDAHALLDRLRSALDKAKEAMAGPAPLEKPYGFEEVAVFECTQTSLALRDIEEACGQAALLTDIMQDLEDQPTAKERQMQARTLTEATGASTQLLIERHIERLKKSVEQENKRFSLQHRPSIKREGSERQGNALTEAIERQKLEREEEAKAEVLKEQELRAKREEALVRKAKLEEQAKKREERAKKLEKEREEKRQKRIKMGEELLERKAQEKMANATKEIAKEGEGGTKTTKEVEESTEDCVSPLPSQRRKNESGGSANGVSSAGGDGEAVSTGALSDYRSDALSDDAKADDGGTVIPGKKKASRSMSEQVVSAPGSTTNSVRDGTRSNKGTMKMKKSASTTTGATTANPPTEEKPSFDRGNISETDNHKTLSRMLGWNRKKKEAKTMLVRHAGGVTSIACILDRSGHAYSLTGGVDMCVVLADVVDNDIVERWRGHQKPVTKVLFSKDGSMYSGDAGGMMYRWVLGQAKPQGRFQEHADPITGLCVNPTGDRLVSGSRDFTVRLWDIERQKVIGGEYIMDNLVTECKWIPEQQCFLQSSEDHYLRVWDTRTMSVVQTFPKCPNSLSSCDVHKRGNHFLSASAGTLLKEDDMYEATLWDRRQRMAIKLYRGHEQALTSCAFLPAMRGWPQLIATCGVDCSVRVWYTMGGECAAQVTVPEVGAFTSIAGDGVGGVHCGSVWKDVYTMQLSGQ